MATAYHNLSDYDFNSVPNAENMRFGIVVSEWNSNITGPLLEGAVTTLKKHGAKKVGNPPGLSTFLNVQSIKCVGTEPMFYRLHAPGSGSLCVSGRKILRREKRLQALTAPHRGYRLPPACRTGVSPHPARASVPAPTSAWR